MKSKFSVEKCFEIRYIWFLIKSEVLGKMKCNQFYIYYCRAVYVTSSGTQGYDLQKYILSETVYLSYNITEVVNQIMRNI